MLIGKILLTKPLDGKNFAKAKSNIVFQCLRDRNLTLIVLEKDFVKTKVVVIAHPFLEILGFILGNGAETGGIGLRHTTPASKKSRKKPSCSRKSKYFRSQSPRRIPSLKPRLQQHGSWCQT